ncbi:MAG: hypothetical protein QMD21_01620 [Candidatus Thermoplasmatota archaeon]|nr:hypothetical protein [Candidatus Thermoplasmatota archaeon]MDI6855469.1 hypothetical protein [Candidatus Thermoplasmatota archaeon]
MRKIDWLNWNGSRKENENKARLQALHILINQDFVDGDLVEKLFREILKIHSPSFIYEEGSLRKYQAKRKI